MSAEVETMFYAGETPWHGIGTAVEKAKTSEQAIKMAGLDWEVALGPVWAGAPGKKDSKEVAGKFAIYRVTDGTVYATQATSRYQVWQNREAFDFLDSLLQDGVLHYETAGALFNGARIWALARLEEGMQVGDDEFHQYMLLTTGHDLYGSIQVLPTNVRVVCNNTLTAALGAGRNGRVKISHMPGMESKLKQARDAFRITTESNRRMKEWLETLTTVKVADTRLDAVVDGIFDPVDEDTGSKRRVAVDRFRLIYAAESERSGKTGYALVNAFSGYADHALTYNGDPDQRAESRMRSVIDGAAEKFKENALRVYGALEPKAALTFSS